MAIFEIEAWGPWSPWPAEYCGGDEPLECPQVIPAHFCTAPKRVTTWRTCPNCGDRGTKILSLNPKHPDKPYQCQGCRSHYAPPSPEARRPRRRRDSRDWWFA
ncbi:hypothetical protein V1279_002962 [Bradyrhizobium sp. AZCC 1610]|uniref:hypothetical protein n=1 Tax=Bradyrhizobium sp. AZCC 1610 TaxID=3117020 RepID=UPI002FF1D83B